jgi:hypothetical protein
VISVSGDQHVQQDPGFERTEGPRVDQSSTLEITLGARETSFRAYPVRDCSLRTRCGNKQSTWDSAGSGQNCVRISSDSVNAASSGDKTRSLGAESSTAGCWETCATGTSRTIGTPSRRPASTAADTLAVVTGPIKGTTSVPGLANDDLVSLSPQPSFRQPVNIRAASRAINQRPRSMVNVVILTSSHEMSRSVNPASISR